MKDLLNAIKEVSRNNYVDFRTQIINKLNEKAKDRYEIEKVIVANKMFNEATFSDPDREFAEGEKEFLNIHKVEEIELDPDTNEWKVKQRGLLDNTAKDKK